LVVKTLRSILNQTIEVNEIVVIDDHSRILHSESILKLSPKIKLIVNKKNEGRGYCRNLGVNVTTGNFILMVDATNFIEPDFIKKSIIHFSDSSIGAVSGAITSLQRNNVLERWRARHLFKENERERFPAKCSMLITYGTLFSRDAINNAGGFNPNLRYKEDQDLGTKFQESGIYVIGDPNISIYCLKLNSLTEVLERYARWYMDVDEIPTLQGYLHNIKGSFKPMMVKDLVDGDIFSIFISLLTPHFQLFHSLKTYLKRISN
jgi:glycosyltransferase involved in cell wall biosynthesis